MRTQLKRDSAPLSPATDRQSKTLEGPLGPPPARTEPVESPGELMKRIRHSLVFSIAVTTFGTAFYIMLLVGFAWLVCADIIFLK